MTEKGRNKNRRKKKGEEGFKRVRVGVEGLRVFEDVLRRGGRCDWGRIVERHCPLPERFGGRGERPLKIEEVRGAPGPIFMTPYLPPNVY